MIEIDVREVKILAANMKRIRAVNAWKRVVPSQMRLTMEEAKIYPKALRRPRRGAWYDRGFGTRYIKMDGGRGASQRTSQNLKSKWKLKNNRLFSSIENRASYAKYVVGTMQTGRHERTGWPKLENVMDKRIPMILRMLSVELTREMRKL